MNSNNDPRVNDLMARWRAQVGVPTGGPASDWAARFAAAARTAARRPPGVGLPFALAEVAKAWHPDWTAAVRASAAWPGGERLGKVRDLIAVGDLRAATFKLESLLADACPPARRVLAEATTARTLDAAAEPPTPDAWRAGLEQFVAWLGRLA